jgi:enoyl-CoA hydratase/carnithine racemase
MLLSGQRMTAQELEANNVIVKACEDQDHLMTESLAFAAAFDKKRGIFRELKQRMHKDLIQVLDDEDPVYIEPINLFVAD